jgi:hypothetical protein
MKTIPIKAVIGNYFKINPDQKRISFKRLSELKKGIEKKFGEMGIITNVEYNRDNLVNLAKSFTQSFNVNFDNKEINYLNEKELVYLTSTVPHDIKEEFMRYLKDLS